uniref:hypothetical protein n=1 Tax=Clostridium sp. NkU-1 TaxID=1095009 RepID=UPI0032615724
MQRFLPLLITWIMYYLFRDIAMVKEIIKHQLFNSCQNSDSNSMGVVKTPSKLLVIGAAEGAARAWQTPYKSPFRLITLCFIPVHAR